MSKLTLVMACWFLFMFTPRVCSGDCCCR